MARVQQPYAHEIQAGDSNANSIAFSREYQSSVRPNNEEARIAKGSGSWHFWKFAVDLFGA
jgi:hypothetical protein